MGQRPLYIPCRIGIIIKGFHGLFHFVLDVRPDHFHPFHVFHVVGTESWILL